MNKITWATKITWYDVGVLSPPPWNYKGSGDDETRERFRASLRENKITPLHVAKCKENKKRIEVCDGAHRLEDLKALGIKRVPCFDHGTLSKAQRQALSLRYNGDWFETEAVPLAQCLDSILQELPDAEESLPLSPMELDHTLSLLDTEIPDAVSPPESDKGPDKTPKKKPKCKTVMCPYCDETFEV